MLQVPKEKIIEKLNSYTRAALQRASEICIEQSAFEVNASHFTLAILEQEASDARKILAASGLDMDALTIKVNKSFDFVKKGATDLPQFATLLLELLQDAWMVSSAELEANEITSGAVVIAIARGADRYCHHYFYTDFASLDGNGIIASYGEITRGSMEHGARKGEATAAPEITSDSALEKFGRDITKEASEGRIDPVFCRDDEIALMTDVLCRRRKNNPILVGDPGVGKTALAEGLAIKINEGDVPIALQGAKLWELDLGALQAGASVKGEFERRLKAVIDEVQSSAEKIILFIDEAHTLIGGGGQAGGSDAANLLKPALARGELRVVAATTWSEYKKYFEKDAALSRRFHVVKLDEPTVLQAVDILRGLRNKYEQVHNVYISDAALYAAASLSARYMTGRQLPDKALDVLDTASVRVSSAQTAKPKRLDVLEKKIQLHERALEALKRDELMRSARLDKMTLLSEEEFEALQQQAEALRTQWDDEKKTVDEIVTRRSKISELVEDDDHDQAEVKTLQLQVEDRLAKLNTLHEKGDALVDFEVGAGIVSKVISDWTGVPSTSMSDDDASKILDLGDKIQEVVRGQDHAITIIHDRLKSARLDFTNEGQPMGVFLLVGPSGVGKTETALQVAEHLYGGTKFVTTINMSEYQEKHTVSRLIGSPPGYVGYGEGGVLTEAIRKMPYSVVLLDEVEKAHPDILNLFFQAFDKGELNDGEGREIDCKNIVFFLTSNLGSDAIMQNRETVENASVEQLDKAIRPHLDSHFKPALLARMRVLIYKPLPAEVMSDIVALKLKGYANRLLDKRNLVFEWDDELQQTILGLCDHAENGARMVDQVIDRWIIPSIAEESLQRMVVNTPLEKVIAHVADGGIDLEFLPFIDTSSSSETVSE